MIGVGVGLIDCALRDEAVSVRGATLDFKSGNVPGMAGYSSTRAGTEIRLSSAGTVTSFAANAAAIISGDGYFSQAAVTNLMLQSQALDNGTSWVRAPAPTGDVATAPDGTNTADQASTTSATLPETYQLKTLSVTPYTVSFFFKKNASNTRWAYIFLGGGGNALAFFDLTNGVPGTVSGSGSGKSSTMVALPNGWFLCTLTANATSGSAAYGCGWSTVNTTATAVNGTGGYVWQGQLVLGSDIGPIIPTTTASVASVQGVLSVTVANGNYTETTTFDDASTQVRSITVSGTTYTVPVYPTILNRPLVQKIVLT